jgi:hypothetical protein
MNLRQARKIANRFVKKLNKNFNYKKHTIKKAYKIYTCKILRKILDDMVDDLNSKPYFTCQYWVHQYWVHPPLRYYTYTFIIEKELNEPKELFST